MATQQSIVFAETIRAMKLAMRRRDNDSDSEESIKQPTNRGNKLKRNASYVREGRLDTTGGRSYKRKVEHAGYQRYIIQANPLRYDEDGDLVDDEEDPDGAYSSPAEDNPWAESRLEDLLAPLTSAADLADHPTLSAPFTSKALTEMAQSARKSLHRERKVLWGTKQLLLRFRGDDPWVPVGKLETDHDILLLDPNAATTAPQSLANETDLSMNESALSLDDHAQITANGTSDTANAIPKSQHNGDIADPSGALTTNTTTNGVNSIDMAMDESREALVEKNGTEHEPLLLDQKPNTLPADDSSPGQQNELHQDHEMGNTEDANGTSPGSAEPDSPTDSSSNQPQHRMTTRARARTPGSPAQDGSPSPSPAPSSIPPIHGFFHVPSVALPDRDFGLPVSEAEETRRLLILFVQKQDQVVREAEQMLEGLLKADRLRKDVYRWSKAEGHVGELSDGEDWYDREEWKLDADLLKGKEEEEIEEEGRGKPRRRRGAQH